MQFSDIVKNISQILRFDSSQSEPKEGAPFGEGAKKSLDYFLALAQSMGFETKDYDGYAGEVIFGSGEEFAILAHLDVVPAGSGWSHDPFGGEIDEKAQRIWGRGAMDDKGPAVIVLHALGALKEEGFIPNRKIKLIVGCNEESGWKCIDYYKAHAHMPDEGFSPDADFPVIYAEKGILQLKLKFPVNGSYSGVKGGERPNMVCDYCQAPVIDDDYYKFGLERRGDKVIARGISAHGSTPDDGINAIPKILSYLGLVKLRDLLFDDGFDLLKLKDTTGSLTFSPDMIEGGEGYLEVVVDIRYPATYTSAQVLEHIEKKGVAYEILHEQLPLYNDENCFLIKTLCAVYNEVTGKSLKPVAIGGGTYARALKCGAAFGPEEAGEENVIHQPNEYITFDKIKRCFEIYKLAIKRLTA